MGKRASTVSINDQEQLILNQVLSKFSEKDKKGASPESEADDQSKLKAPKDSKRGSIKQVKVFTTCLNLGIFTDRREDSIPGISKEGRLYVHVAALWRVSSDHSDVRNGVSHHIRAASHYYKIPSVSFGNPML